MEVEEETFDGPGGVESGPVGALRQCNFADFLLAVVVPGAGAFDGARARLLGGLKDVFVVLAVIGAGPVEPDFVVDGGGGLQAPSGAI